MPTPKISPVSEAVSRRFFLAIETLASYKLVSSLGGFCDLYGFSSPRYREMRLQYGTSPTLGHISRYKNVEIAALTALVANYPISALWLLTGRGSMLTKKI